MCIKPKNGVDIKISFIDHQLYTLLFLIDNELCTAVVVAPDIVETAFAVLQNSDKHVLA